MAKRFDAVRWIYGAPKAALIGLVRFYQIVLSPVKFAIFGPASRCRFEPSCSGYAIQALRRHGIFRGTWLALRRLARCHPWGDFGPDPVPPARVRAGKESNIVAGGMSDKRAFGLCACAEKTEKTTQPEAALRCC